MTVLATRTAGSGGIDTAAPPLPDLPSLARQYAAVRALSEKICEPLEIEDYVVQSMPDCSPAKWHLAHTSWFFETFVLNTVEPDYRSPHPQYDFLFNSYYNSVGDRHCRAKRGLVSRPTVPETWAYRQHVDDHMMAFLTGAPEERIAAMAPIVTLGLHHEQQHQELMLTDLKHMFSENPLLPAYSPLPCAASQAAAVPLAWTQFDGGVTEIGYDGDGFFYDNEGPRHRVFLEPYALGSRLVTCGEYLEFMNDGGYERPEFWLSEGWNTIKARGWNAPLYWEQGDEGWHQFTLHGLRPVDPAEPVCHVSLFEADAYASWAGARLPTEFEWEAATAGMPVHGNFVDDGLLHPAPANPIDRAANGLMQMYGDVWEWTRSSYAPYPGYYPAPGALGEYNGKFMCNQYVLRGGSCGTSQSHIRPTYRNFFPSDARWQFMGIRLAKDLS
jgi:ergothioneine biosynthesis protein EgtB